MFITLGGNLRWQAPEIMSGQSNLTPQADVYSFGIVCYEILSGGQVPWSMLDDQTVQRLVLGAYAVLFHPNFKWMLF